MWSSLNHTTCSLNMNYIHLRSVTSGLIVAAFVELLCNSEVRQEEDSGFDLNEVILFRPIQQLGYWGKSEPLILDGTHVFFVVLMSLFLLCPHHYLMGHRVSIKPMPQMEAYHYDGDAVCSLRLRTFNYKLWAWCNCVSSIRLNKGFAWRWMKTWCQGLESVCHRRVFCGYKRRHAATPSVTLQDIWGQRWKAFISS